MNNQIENMFAYNTFNIADGKYIQDCQLETGNGIFYPKQVSRPFTELTKTYIH